MYFDEYECGIYFNKVWNCPERSVDSETNTVFEEHLTQKHHFLFVYFMNVAFIGQSVSWGIKFAHAHVPCACKKAFKTCVRCACVRP